MQFRNQRNRSVQFVIALFIITFLLLFLDGSGGMGEVQGVIRNPLSNLTRVFSGLTTLLRRPADLQTAYTEIKTLQNQVATLEQENEQLRSLQSEYGQLRELLNHTQQTPNLKRVTADVIGRGPNPLFRDMIINRGTNDGVRVGMPVESARGLVGIIHRASRNAAQVRLLTDAGSRIPARLNTSRGIGIIRGMGASGQLVLDWVELTSPVSINEVVLTSGLEGATKQELVPNRFPADLIIGRVVDIQRGSAELFQQLIVQPAVDFSTLETVAVIIDFTPLDTSVFDTGTPP